MENINIWYAKPLGDGMWAAMPSAELEEIFQPLFASAGKPVEMAVFTRHESEGRLHCEMIAYFSPEAGEIARSVGAYPCEKPEREGLGLLAGDPRCWAALFSESEV